MIPGLMDITVPGSWLRALSFIHSSVAALVRAIDHSSVPALRHLSS
jgi:hypothetical protein